VAAPGATWLDYRLVERERMPLAMGGFGQEVRDALGARAEHLAAEGLAERQGARIVPQRDLLATLRRRELDAAGARLSVEKGLPYTPAASGETVSGTYRQRLTLTSGRFAMIDNGVGFALVPWTPALDKRLGRHVAASPRRAAGSSGVSGAGAGWRSEPNNFRVKNPMDQLTLSYVWKQKQIPVVLRRTGRGEQLRVRLPFANDNR
jgi:Protein of unknown function (DUF3363)